MIMVAMWMLSGSTIESGADDMMQAILLRGLGLGFLFLSITLIAFGKLNDQNLASGIGLFNTGRQLGGLMGVAWLQTLIENNVAANVAVLGANVTAGIPAVSERLATTTAMLAAKGMDSVAAGRAATSLLGRAVAGQSTVIAFDTAFNAVALLFVIAAPVLVTIKIGLSRYMRKAHGTVVPGADRGPDADRADARHDPELAVSNLGLERPRRRESEASGRGAVASLTNVAGEIVSPVLRRGCRDHGCPAWRTVSLDWQP